MNDHEHKWTIDFGLPTVDVNPIHYALFCECGATACGDPEGEPHFNEIHNIKQPSTEPSSEASGNNNLE